MSEQKSSHWASTIPEIFYDLLARVLPGALALGLVGDGYGCFRAWILHIHSSVSLTQTGFSSLVLALVVIVVCWTTGLLLTPAGDSLWRGDERAQVFASVVREHGPLMQRAEDKGIFVHRYGPNFWNLDSTGAISKETADSAGLIYQQLHEYLKDRRDDWRGVLTKNQAEVTFYANVAAAVRLYIIGSTIVVPSAFFIMRVDASPYLFLETVGFLLTAYLPALLILRLARKGMLSKNQRLWTRHISCLTVDLMSAVSRDCAAGDTNEERIEG